MPDTKTFPADIAYTSAVADGLPDEAEELLEDLSAAESFVTTAPSVVGRATDTEVARWRAERAERRADAS